MSEHVDLPSPARVLADALDATERAKHSGTLDTPGWFEYARIRLDIARELREGARMPFRQPGEAAMAADDESQIWYDASTFGDQAEDQTVLIPAHHEQPMPVVNARGSIQALVRHDLVERERVGVQRYGTPLQAFNGRSALRDLYEELLDAACYAKQLLVEDEDQTQGNT